MKLFTSIASELEASEARRELVIKASREILRDAKKIIFLCHEGNLTEANKQLAVVTVAIVRSEKSFKSKLGKGAPVSLYREGSWNAAIEEYLEAWFFCNFLSSNKLVEPAIAGIPAEVSVGALSDFTGEVVRVAVMRGASKDKKVLAQFRKVVADIVAFMLPLYLSGQNRMKFDQAKRNLKRIEEIIYEVNIRT